MRVIRECPQGWAVVPLTENEAMEYFTNKQSATDRVKTLRGTVAPVKLWVDGKGVFYKGDLAPVSVDVPDGHLLLRRMTQGEKEALRRIGVTGI